MKESLMQTWNLTQAYHREYLRQPSEPRWSTELREQAWETYQNLPEALPPQRNLRKVPALDWEALQPPSSALAAEILEPRAQSWGDCRGYYLEQNGQTLRQAANSALEAMGVIFMPLAEALLQHEALVKPYLGQILPASQGQEQALNLAYWQGGYFLYIPRKVKLDLPLYALQSVSEGEQALFSRSLIVLESQAEVCLIHDAFALPQATSARFSEQVEIHLGDGAHLEVVYMQQWGHKLHYHHYHQAQLGRDARYTALNLSIGAEYHYSDVGATLAEKGAEAVFLGLNIGDGDQHFRQNTRQIHQSPYTRSDLLYHTVLRDQAYAFFNGMIYVAPEGQQTESNQVSKSLILSEKARADAIPNLEILADDVQSGHGAAIGSLDADQRYYLMTRGFDQKTAEDLIVEGFMEAVLSRFGHEALKERISAHLALRLLQGEEVVE